MSACAWSPTTTALTVPASAPALGMSTRSKAPHAARSAAPAESPAVLLVSPVSAITSDLKSLPGTNLAFSGRFSGVPLLAGLALAPTPPALAAAFASNAAEPSTAVSWMVTHLTCWATPSAGP